MPRLPLTPVTIGNRVVLLTKLREHDLALDALETGAVGFEAVNADDVALALGAPVASVIGGVVRSTAASQMRAGVVGLVVRESQPTLPARVQPNGAVSLTPSQWTALTGEPGGLTPGARYYLDADPGKITSTPPAAPNSLTYLGRAISNYTFVLGLDRPIQQ